MKKTLAMLALAAGVTLAAGNAMAESGVKIGTLSCKVSGGAAYIVGSNRDLTCNFKGLNGSHEKYTGSIQKVGIDLGNTDEAAMGWVVIALGGMEDGALAGNYVGAAADASLGIGGGAKVLIGGFERSFMLQPISLQAQTGVNLALTVAAMQLSN
jgi:hypothetical protein